MDKNDFQPMPKRFMVWDKIDREFVIINSRSKVGTLEGVVREFQYNPYVLSQCVVVQSTNLFGKDNKEIFEGSIVEDEDGDRAVIVYRYGTFVIQWVAAEYESYALDEVVTTSYKVVGHVFSNPELLEEG